MSPLRSNGADIPEGERTPFEEAVLRVLPVEGDYGAHRLDPDGKTHFGISRSEARAWGYEGLMRELPLEAALTIYRERYWKELRGDDVAKVSPEVAAMLFEASVNVGPRHATRWLQRWLNTLSRGGRDYVEIAVNGRVDEETLGALVMYARERDVRVLTRALNAQQATYYRDLAAADPERYGSFLHAWMHRWGEGEADGNSPTYRRHF